MSKGGMSQNPFGGEPSLATYDEDVMMSLHRHEISIDQALALRIIKMSVRDYLYFGLGKNGITPEKFIEAYRYLYRERKDDPGMPANVKAKCFETHYEDSGLRPAMTIDTFLNKLKEKKTAIVNANEKQIHSYMDEYRSQEWRSLPRGWRCGKQVIPRRRVVSLLVAPEDIKAFAGLYLYARRKAGVAQRDLAKRVSKALIYKKLLF
jgi:hypothetical protein